MLDTKKIDLVQPPNEVTSPMDSPSVSRIESGTGAFHESCVFTHDGQHLITLAPRSWSLSVTNTTNGLDVRTIDLSGPHSLPNSSLNVDVAIRVSPDSQALAVNVHGEIRLYDLASGRCWCHDTRTGHAGSVTAMAVSADGQIIAMVAMMAQWESGRQKQAAPGLARWLCGSHPYGCFAGDSKQLLTSDRAGQLALWRLDTAGDEFKAAQLVWQRSMDQLSDADAPAMAVDPTGKQYAIATRDGSIILGHLEDGREQRSLFRGQGSAFSGLAYDTSGQILASATPNGLSCWNSQTGAVISQSAFVHRERAVWRSNLSRK